MQERDKGGRRKKGEAKIKVWRKGKMRIKRHKKNVIEKSKQRMKHA